MGCGSSTSTNAAYAPMNPAPKSGDGKEVKTSTCAFCGGLFGFVNGEFRFPNGCPEGVCGTLTCSDMCTNTHRLTNCLHFARCRLLSGPKTKLAAEELYAYMKNEFPPDQQDEADHPAKEELKKRYPNDLWFRLKTHGYQLRRIHSDMLPDPVQWAHFSTVDGGRPMLMIIPLKLDRLDTLADALEEFKVFLGASEFQSSESTGTVAWALWLDDATLKMKWQANQIDIIDQLSQLSLNGHFTTSSEFKKVREFVLEEFETIIRAHRCPGYTEAPFHYHGFSSDMRPSKFFRHSFHRLIKDITTDTQRQQTADLVKEYESKIGP